MALGEAYLQSWQGPVKPLVNAARTDEFTAALGGIPAANSAGMLAMLKTGAEQMGETMRTREALQQRQYEFSQTLKANKRVNAFNLASSFGGGFGGSTGGGRSGVTGLVAPSAVDPFQTMNQVLDARQALRIDEQEATRRSKATAAAAMRNAGVVGGIGGLSQG